MLQRKCKQANTTRKRLQEAAREGGVQRTTRVLPMGYILMLNSNSYNENPDYPHARARHEQKSGIIERGGTQGIERALQRKRTSQNLEDRV